MKDGKGFGVSRCGAVLPVAVKKMGAWLCGPAPVSILLALIVGALFMFLAGVNPVRGYAAMLGGSFGSGYGFARLLSEAIPIIGLGLAIAVAFRAGVLNLGTEGQAGLGALAGGVIALFVPGPAVLVLPLALAGGVAAGLCWAALAAFLQNGLGVPILLSSLLLNYPVRFFSSWYIRFVLDEPQSDLVASAQFPVAARIGNIVPPRSVLGKTLSDVLGQGSLVFTHVNWSIVIVLFLAVAVAFMNRRTRFGFESGVAGVNPRFALYSGVGSASLVMRTMLLSGGLAGLLGVLFTVGAPNTRLIEGAFVQYGYAWTALLVTLLALYRPFGTVVAGLFFAAIVVGSGALSRESGLSPQISAIVQAFVIILLGFRVVLPVFWGRRFFGVKGRGVADVAQDVDLSARGGGV